jgi:hypothetical protein
VDAASFIQYVFDVQSFHQQGIREVHYFVLRTDAMLERGDLLETYQTQVAGGPDSALNLYLQMKLATDMMNLTMRKFGVPKYGRGAPDLASQLLLNQDTYAEAIWLQFAYQCKAIGAALYCLQDNREYKTFEKYLHWKKGETTFGGLVEVENDQYRALTYSKSNAIFGFEQKKTQNEIAAHAETSVLQLRTLNKLRKRSLQEIDSLVPWLLLKTKNVSLSKFDF